MLRIKSEKSEGELPFQPQRRPLFLCVCCHVRSKFWILWGFICDKKKIEVQLSAAAL